MTEDRQSAGGGQSQQDEIARVREQWQDVVRGVVAACNGNQSVAKQLAPFLNEMEQKAEWRALINVLRRILAGERDALELLRGLDETDTLVAGDVLRGLGIDAPTPALPRSQDQRTGEGAEDDDDGAMLSLDELLKRVVAACKPGAPAGLMEQLLTVTRGMATQPNLQPELRELGLVLNLILSGEQNPDLSTLHPQLAEAVTQVLEELLG